MKNEMKKYLNDRISEINENIKRCYKDIEVDANLSNIYRIESKVSMIRSYEGMIIAFENVLSELEKI